MQHTIHRIIDWFKSNKIPIYRMVRCMYEREIFKSQTDRQKFCDTIHTYIVPSDKLESNLLVFDELNSMVI